MFNVVVPFSSMGGTCFQVVVLYSALRCICTEFEAAVAPGGPAELLIACDRPVLQFKLIFFFLRV